MKFRTAIRRVVLAATTVALIFLTTALARAEGSDELNNNDGDRVWLHYYGDGTTTAGIVRDNDIKVYTREGETLHLGSSAMGIGNGDILWVTNDGSTGKCSDQSGGLIANRVEEVAGPAPLAAAGGYAPCTLTVGAGQGGVWIIVFTSPSNAGGGPIELAARGDWTQGRRTPSIAAWDITVVGTDGAEKPGRAYANYLPMTMRGVKRSLEAEVYVLTEDGYIYREDFNGLQPTNFIIFSNKKGIKVAATNEPSYQSVLLLGGETNNFLPPEFALNAPDDPDVGTDITNKIFFNQPDPSLPATTNVPALGSRPAFAGWLFRAPVPPIAISGLTYTPAAPGPGGTFTFNSNSDGGYQFAIDTNGDGEFGFENDIILTGEATSGANTVVWNGLDADGSPTSPNVCYSVGATGLAGEVHFVNLDAEENPSGVIIERLNGANAPDFLVHYNDIPIGGAQALNGENSATGAHAWTVLPGGDPQGFGNQKGIDTWAYALGENSASIIACELPKLTATKGDSLLTDADDNGLASPGDVIRYIVTLTNEGGTDANNVGFSDIPDANTTLVVGSVQSSQGTVAAGNGAGDTSIAVTIGTLAPNGTVNIQFDVTVNDPLPAGVVEVANQGIATSDSSTVPTDDPDTPEPDDPTKTPLVASPNINALKSDSLVIDVDGNGFASPSDRIEYEITIANTGNEDATDVIFTDVPGAYTTLVPGTVTTSAGMVEVGNGAGDQTVRVNIGTLAGEGGTATIRFRVDIDGALPASVAQVENQGIVRGTDIPFEPTDDPDTQLPDDSTITRLVAAPEITATKADSLFVDADDNGIPGPGDTLLYQIVVMNTGNASAGNVSFSDVPDTNTTLVAGSVKSSQGTVTTGNGASDMSIEIALGDIAPNAEINITFLVTINAPLLVGVTQVANQGTITGNDLPQFPISELTDDPDTPQPNDPTVTPVTADPLLLLSKRDVLAIDTNGDGAAGAGDTLLYQLTLLNNGNGIATAVTFTDTPDANTTLVNGSVQSSQGMITIGNGAGESSIEIALGDIAPNAEIDIAFQVTVVDPLPVGVIQVANQGIVSTPSLDLDIPSDDPDTTTPDDATVTPLVDELPVVEVAIQKSAQPAPNSTVFAGDVITYRVTVTNAGTLPLANVTITDSIPAGTTYVANSASPAATGPDPLVWTIPSIAAGGNVVVQFAVQVQDVAAGTVIPNVAVVASDQAPPTASNQVVHLVNATPAPQLTIRKSSTPTSGTAVLPGDRIDYSLTIQNLGNVPLNNATISDSVPEGTTYVADSATPAPSSGPNPLVWTVASVLVGESVTIQFSVTVDPAIEPQTILNVAAAFSNETQAELSNEVTHPITSPTAISPTDEPISEQTEQLFMPLIWR